MNDRISEMVSFELGKEIEKDVFRPVTSVGQDEKIQSPGGIVIGDLESFLCPTLVTRRKTFPKCE